MNTPHLGKIDHPFLMNADHDNQKWLFRMDFLNNLKVNRFLKLRWILLQTLEPQNTPLFEVLGKNEKHIPQMLVLIVMNPFK